MKVESGSLLFCLLPKRGLSFAFQGKGLNGDNNFFDILKHIMIPKLYEYTAVGSSIIPWGRIWRATSFGTLYPFMCSQELMMPKNEHIFIIFKKGKNKRGTVGKTV